MTAWEELTENSSLIDGTAWDPLNAQKEGGKTLYVDAMEADILAAVAVATTEFEVLELSFIDSTLQIGIDNFAMEISLQSIELVSEKTEAVLESSLSSSVLSATLLEETV